MTTHDFNEIVKEQLTRCENLLISKGDEYAMTDDRLSAFKKAGALQGQTMLQAALGMLAKHLVSVVDMIQDKNPKRFGLDRWNEKLTDAINYLLIMRAIIEEEEPNEKH